MRNFKTQCSVTVSIDTSGRIRKKMHKKDDRKQGKNYPRKNKTNVPHRISDNLFSEQHSLRCPNSSL